MEPNFLTGGCLYIRGVGVQLSDFGKMRGDLYELECIGVTTVVNLIRGGYGYGGVSYTLNTRKRYGLAAIFSHALAASSACITT